MTIPMLMLMMVAITAIVAAFWALYREYDERTKELHRAKVWAARADAAKKARPELLDERVRLASFRLRPLSEEDQAQFRSAWRRTRVQFVDDPARAIVEADQLIGAIMYARGVPAWTLEHDQATPLAWRHPELETQYRTAKKIALETHRGNVSSQELHQALAAYSAICERLLDAA